MKQVIKLSATMPKFARYLAVAVDRGLISIDGVNQIAGLVNRYPQVVPFNAMFDCIQDFPSLDCSLDWGKVKDILESDPTAINLDALIASVSDPAVDNAVKRLSAIAGDETILSKERQNSIVVDKAPKVFDWLNVVFITNGLFRPELLSGEETFTLCVLMGSEPDYEENCDLDKEPLYPAVF